MLKASRVLLRVAAIVGTVFGALILACVPVFFVIGFSPTIHDMLVKAMNDGTIQTNTHDLSFETIVFFLQAMFIVLGVTLLIVGACCVVNAVIAVKTREEPTRGRYIACIVTGALSTDFSIIAAIFGLICLKRAERQNNIIE